MLGYRRSQISNSINLNPDALAVSEQAALRHKHRPYPATGQLEGLLTTHQTSLHHYREQFDDPSFVCLYRKNQHDLPLLDVFSKSAQNTKAQLDAAMDPFT
jgi:hypothetical protein